MEQKTIELPKLALGEKSRADSAVVHLLVGMPGAGKTTYAKALEAEANALRLTPDEWQLALFGQVNPSDKRLLIDGKLVEIGLRAAALGTNVIFDFGLWKRDERYALRALSEDAGATCSITYFPIDSQTQCDRVSARYIATPQDYFWIDDRQLEAWREEFEEPDEQELACSTMPEPPAGYESWREWGSKKWRLSAERGTGEL